MSQERSGGVIAPSEMSLSEMQVILQGLGTDFSERVAKATSFFRSVAQNCNKAPYSLQRVDQTDKETLFWCKMLAQIHEATSEELFCSLLIDKLYWDLPPISHRAGYDPVNWAPFLETKKWVWKRIIQQWDPSLGTPGLNMDIFLFLVAAFQPTMNGIDGIFWPIKDESPYERKSQGRLITSYEQGQLLEFINQRVKDVPILLDYWFSFPRVPMEIRKKLAHAWVNERGWRELPTLFACSAAIKKLKGLFDSLEFSSTV